jgi:Rad3-related DNA helicase
MKSFFPFDKFRAGQSEILEIIESNWDKYDVIVVRAPVGFGKSPIASTIQARELDAGNGCCIVVPNNLLREQYLEDYPDMITIKRQDEYWIEQYKMTEAAFRKKIYKWGPKDSEYTRDYRAVRRKGTPVVANYYTYLAHKLQRNTLIVDEAHSLLGTLQDLSAKRIWKHEYRYPDDARSFYDLLQWVGSNPSDSKLKRLRGVLESNSKSTLLRFANEPYRGEWKDCLKLLPLNVSDLPNPFWGSKVDKIVLMSATIGPMDIEKMGLSNRRVLYLDVPSPIPVDQRPIHFQPVGNMSFATQNDNLPDLAAKLIQLADSQPGKGFVHAPYNMASKLSIYLKDDDRFMFHNRGNKKEQYKRFYALPSSSNAVMVGSGMTEGLDLKYEVAQWQALTKVPYPSLSDPAMRHLAEDEPDYYNWLVSRDVMQASGRICRGPDDTGSTFLLDSQFDIWYNKYKSSLPSWFTDAMKGI